MSTSIRTDVSDKKISKIQDFLDETNLNWTVSPIDLVTVNGIDVANYKAIVREDNNKPLAVVKNSYYPIQLQEAFSFLDIVIEKETGFYNYAYEINGGRQVIVQAKIDGNFTVGKNDEISKYLTCVTSFDGTKALEIFYTPIRLFCKNQLRAAIAKSYNSVVIRHTKNAEAKMEEALKVIAGSENYFVAFKEKANALIQKAVDKKMVEKFLNELFDNKESTKTDNNKADIIKLFESGNGNSGNNLWDLYNGTTEYVDHFRGKDEEKRISSSMIGSGDAMKLKAWHIVNEMV